MNAVYTARFSAVRCLFPLEKRRDVGLLIADFSEPLSGEGLLLKSFDIQTGPEKQLSIETITQQLAEMRRRLM